LSFVLDSSVAVGWCFAAERTNALKSLLDRLTDERGVVPSHWPLEILNALVMAERRGRVTQGERRRLVAFLRNLPLTVDSETAARAWTEVQALAERFRLTSYDAAYLELAERLTLPLATLDQDLRAAGQAMGLELLGV
jgi:predicted nucleic acid-binding protein